MWIFEQKTGRLLHDETYVATGYAGFGEGKNNPALEQVHNVGPLPKGNYTIGMARDTHDHGPCVLPLTPDPKNEMYGRAGFLIHGDSIPNPGTASHGCMIFARPVRNKISESEDRELQVV